jgi:hypothetical protein
MERDTAMLENGPDFDRELLPAFLFLALPEADTGLPFAVYRLASGLELGGVPDRAAMGADWAIGPQGRL